MLFGIPDKIAETGFFVTRNFLPETIISSLIDEAKCLWSEGEFKKAGIGRGENMKIISEIRKDHIHWVEPENLSPALKHYWLVIDELRDELNKKLFLSIIDFEAHYAVYPPGSFYKKHHDQFKNVQHRLISCILYLNREWNEKDGGQLRIYSQGSSNSFIDIYPHSNTFVCFRSDTVLHEVLPTSKQRYTLTGWLKRESLVL